MNSLIRKILFVYSLLVITSCATRVPFTASVKQECGLNEEQLQHIQFYTSGEIVLQKVKESSDAYIKRKGKIVVSQRKDAETIIIPKNTPCVLEKVMGQKFIVSFEFGQGKLLAFGCASGGNYSLMAKSWEDRSGLIEYGYGKYQTANGEVYLNVNMKKLKRLKHKYRVVSGRKV